MCNDSDRAYVFRGQRYAQLADSLGDLLRLRGLSCRTAARGFARFTGSSAYGAPASLNRALLAVVLGQRARRFVAGASAARRWREAREAVLWKNVLLRCGARIIVAIQPDTGLCRAAHELGAEVFDLQHGIIDTRENPYYRLDRIASGEPWDSPTGYLTWDERSAEALSPMTVHGARVLVTGNPWFARFLRQEPDDALVRDAIAALPPARSDLPPVLVTLQHGMRQLAPDYIPNGVMADCLATAIRDSCDRFVWQLRLHPSQMTGSDAARVEKYLRATFGGCRNVEWRSCSRAPLPLLLGRACAHITHYSATTIEAAWMGVRTGLLNPHIRPGAKHAHFLVDERERGAAQTLPLDAGAIVRFVESAVVARRASPHGAVGYVRHLDAFADYVQWAVESAASARTQPAGA